MSLSARHVQWAGIVLGAVVYFFLGALTELEQAIQLLIYVAVAFVLPTLLVRAGLFDYWIGVDSPETEYDY